MPNAIEASGLVKHFGATTALAGVDLVARPGTVLGMLGPNGAGKTTAVRILATLMRPDSGTARVCGYDISRQAHQVRQLIGLTGQYASVDEGLSGINNLIMIGRLLGESRPRARARAGELLDRFDLADAAQRPAKTYSGGMRRRLDLAASLVGRPRVLYLDEPTTGLDPRSRTSVWEMIRGLLADGVTVLLTTQYLDEADQLAHDIVVIDHGRVIATGTPDELKNKTGGQVLEVSPASRADLDLVAAVLGRRARARPGTDPASGMVRVPVADPLVLPVIIRDLDEADVELAEFSLRKASLEEVFFALTGDQAGPAAGSGTDARDTEPGELDRSPR
ncbi:MAG: ATP-binding cassette domain-containing protein [Streptosporangiaceae bacterium]